MTTTNTNANPNYRRNYHRRETNAENFMKTFESFEEGYSEMIQLVPEIKGYGGEESIYESVINKILETVADNIPTTKNSYYPNTFSFSIDSHEVGLKTDSGAAFGWRVVFNKEEGKQYYKFRVTFISMPTYRKKIADDLVNNGWEKVETTYQSRFWNSVENKRRNRYNKKNDENTDSTNQNIKGQVTVKEEKPNPDMLAAFEKAGYKDEDPSPEQAPAEAVAETPAAPETTEQNTAE